MKRILFKITLYLMRILVGFVAAVVLYALVALLLSRIPANSDFRETADGTEVYLMSNGVHTDLVLPVRSPLKDWSREIPFENTFGKDTAMRYLAFGWGDKGFYLETPEWSDLKASTAAKALFWLDQSAMHVSFYKELHEGTSCKKVRVGAKEYARLVRYIESSFMKDSSGRFMYIPDRGYHSNDAFYEAKGSYSMFYTCNTWTNEGLKEGGLKAGLWTPFEEGVFYHYR